MADEYTPGTYKVRDAYVQGMRQALIASAAEHADEFDRWLAAHDREVAAKALREAAANWFPHPTLGLARLADDAAKLLRAEADRIESSEKGAGDGEQ